MREDPIVEEMRSNGRAFAARHDNDLARICQALRETDKTAGRRTVNRAPKPLKRQASTS